MPAGVPSELLERRPDIAAAERRMASANASIGVAKGAFYPKVELFGVAGFESVSAGTLFDWPSRFWALGPSINFPLFEGGLLRANCADGVRHAARMCRVILSEFVVPELSAIWEYIALDNMDAADRFLESAYTTFQELARMSGMGRSRNFPKVRLTHMRSFRVRDFKNYLIFYSPIPDGIEVFHVLHGAQDLERFWKSG